jgi:hypothetical protein
MLKGTKGVGCSAAGGSAPPWQSISIPVVAASIPIVAAGFIPAHKSSVYLSILRLPALSGGDKARL